MKGLKLFIGLLFVIGILLVATSFIAYSKITDTCKSKSLRTYLQWCVGLGSALSTISIMYFVCTIKKGCECESNNVGGFKIHLILFVLAAIGGLLVFIVSGIQREIKSGGCDVDLGSILPVLWGISIAQLVLPIIYTVILSYTDKSVSSSYEDEDESSSSRESSQDESMKSVRKRRNVLDRKIANIEADISKNNEKVDKLLVKGASIPKKLQSKRRTLEHELNFFNNRRKAVGKHSSRLHSSSETISDDDLDSDDLDSDDLDSNNLDSNNYNFFRNYQKT